MYSRNSLWGVTNVQAFIYFQTHKGTGMTFFKLVVVWLWILDALRLAFIVHGIYYYLVTNYANLAALQELVWSAKLVVPVKISIVVGVHFLYVHRIWIVSKGRSRALPIIVSILVVLGSGIAISLILAVYRYHLYADLIEIDWATYSTLGAIRLIDICIALSLCYLLATSRTGFSSTDSFVTKLMGNTISTGCLTMYAPSTPPYTLIYIPYSVYSLASIITFAMMPNNFIYLSVKNIGATLYVNSYIALLNARYYLQANANNIDSSECHKRHSIYRPELRMSASQDNKVPTPKKLVFQQPDDEVLHLTRPVQAAMRPIAVTMEMDSFSSV
ncbi:hypothetical protein EV702DRAFT_1279719 [Suillus placidus]|uniref:DUF6534 domain-containing protein n=1 Tax=Suillus placidus TaxID=48579 RepID=A0A9P6ZSP0_9AGAM|nr:hypothetical protein EV702DRAFT_1279719 [Suillus placidus]